MGWDLLAQFAAKGLTLWLMLLAAAVLWRQFVSGPQLVGLLSSAIDHQVHGERVQLAAVSGFILLTLLVRGGGTLTAPGLPHSLPDIPNSLAVAMGGSQAVYLAGKLTRAHAARPQGR